MAATVESMAFAVLLGGEIVLKKADESLAVSGNNPCPFLGALASAGTLFNDREPLGNVVAAIVRTANAGDGAPLLPSAAIVGIGLVGDGALLDTATHGLRLDALRGAPCARRVRVPGSSTPAAPSKRRSWRGIEASRRGRSTRKDRLSLALD
jgi:hypothetical protein